ncbi:MAG: ankyrin repeat protein [Edafosvirus sp.]|uniref:Ankyrin repeat protein n=1 Tax=Edafosvirus sp. TaxID=2487765 RepID=A0A3G4ZWG2_9VIRU|nr:MAG: ankyrin repeat protein [Edafosvirus sp.]
MTTTHEDLICPILGDYFVDPVNLNCCGKAVSRQPLIEWLQMQLVCPLCRANLPDFDAVNAPMAKNLAYLVEKAKKENEEKTIKIDEKDHGWNAKIFPLINDRPSAYQQVIGRLQIANVNTNHQFKTLLIPVIDQSGSMSGKPIEQVKYSLNRILDITYKNPNLLTNIIHYHDIAKSTEIDKFTAIEFYKDIVSKIDKDSGGTNFSASFNEIKKVCGKFESNKEISSIVIIFLTDGIDSSVTADKRIDLVNSLKSNLSNVKKYTLHTVGFGASHDYDFLNNLRQIGTSEGAYRYANPTEDVDSLSNKINSILNVIVSSTGTPVTMVNSPLKIINGENGKYWVNLTKCDLTIPYKFTVSVNNGPPITIDSEFAQFVDFKKEEDNGELWDQWYSYLIDEIAGEMVTLSKQTVDTLDKQIHLELLLQRSKSIGLRIRNPINLSRLEKLCETVKTMQKGGAVDEKKINDMKFEGIYKTQVAVNTTKSKGNNIIPFEHVAPPKPKVPVGEWITISKKLGRYSRRCTSNVVAHYSNADAYQWIIDNTDKLNDVDANGSNLLIQSCCVGRYPLVKCMLETKSVDINHINKNGFTALDMAVLYGYWRTYDLMVKYGAKINQNGDTLLRTCMSNEKLTYNEEETIFTSNKYEEVASRLIRDKLAVVTDEMVDCAPTNDAFQWLSRRVNKIISLEAAITKGLYDIVKEKINTPRAIKTISWLPYLKIFEKADTNYTKIIKLLIENKKADPNEVMDIINPDDEKDITWPLFIACEKGNLELFNLLIQYASVEQLNRQSKKGTTVLWIASCNRHIDIVNVLLDKGADCNIANEKGDTALVSCCQKGNDLLVELLLGAGAKLNVYNRNRDNPILICCRTGHGKILDMLLKHLETTDPPELKSILEQCAEIDGLNPLFGATELNKVECIKVCVKYGAKLETRTANDNKIIQGATPLHLACFYGQFNAVQTLCELKADYTAITTVHGHNPLHLAIKYGHSNIVRYLLSVDKENKNINTMDKEGHLPVYYASMLGNEAILDEFFTNKLGLLLEKVLLSPPEIELKCADTLTKYGQSMSCYNHDFISDITMDKGMSVVTSALINGNKYLVDSLMQLGPDLNKKDNYGVPASFWASYLGYDKKSKPNELTLQMLDRVASAQKKSLQHKMLLNINNDKMITCVDKNEPINIILKMTQNYLMKIKDDVVSQMKSSYQSGMSMLGFLEKLKSNKLTNKLDNVDTVMKDMKIHLISTIASEDDCKLDPTHLMALYLYTGNMAIFNQVNAVLSDWQKHAVWHPYVYNLYQAVMILPAYVGEVYRMVNIPFDQKQYVVGNQIMWNTFSICSGDWNNAKELIAQKKGIIFIIKSLTGRNISKYSKYKVDNEAIFLPGTKFIINRILKPDIIAINQENIRDSTFKATEKDLERAHNKQASIIIEIHEVADVKAIE